MLGDEGIHGMSEDVLLLTPGGRIDPGFGL